MITIIYTHPDPSSFNHAILSAITDMLTGRGDDYQREFGIRTLMIFNQSKDIEYWAAFSRSPTLFYRLLLLIPQRTSCPFDSGTSKSKFTPALWRRNNTRPLPKQVHEEVVYAAVEGVDELRHILQHVVLWIR